MALIFKHEAASIQPWVDQIRDALGDEAAVAAVEEYNLALTRRPASPVSDSDVQYAVAWGHPQQYG